MYSKVNSKFELLKGQCVVSLINTKTGCEGAVGGHAKIIVERLLKEQGPQLFDKAEIFVGEYHIMEANRIPDNTWIPQALRNTHCNYMVLFTERNEYKDGKAEQYEESGSKSWYASPDLVEKMIQNIKEEQVKINTGEQQADFEYFGKWSCFSKFSKTGGYNCVTWAEEKLAIANVGNGKMLLDSSKGMPSNHVECTIF